MTDDAFLHRLIDTVSDGVYFLDRERRITFWSEGAERITGFTADEVVGKRCAENVLVHVDAEGTNLCRHGCPVAGCIGDCQEHEADAFLHHKDGYRLPVHIRAIPMRGEDGEVIGAAEVFRDITPRVAVAQRVEELERLALLDALTEVGNRHYLEMQLASRFDQLQRHGWSFGVLFVDIDHFKPVNDQYGHEVGDRVLKVVARTMQNSLRSYDLIGRWGGEEFIAIVINVQESDLVTVANKLRLLVGHSSVKLDDGERVHVTVSIGATLARLDDTRESLLKRADELMYQSKAGGRNRTTIRMPAVKVTG